MKKTTSGVPYAVIAPLGVLLTLGCCLLTRLLPGDLLANWFGEAYAAALSVVNVLPLHFLVLCIISLPLLISGIVCALTRKKSKVRWIVFAIAAVLYIPLFFVGMVLDTFSPQVAMFFNTNPEVMAYYVMLDRMGMVGLGLAAYVIFLFSHLCMLPRIHTAAKLTGFGVFFVLTLGLTPVYMLLFAAVLLMPAQVMLAALPAALTALLPAGLVLLLMGIFMRPKKAKELPVEDAPAPAPEQPAAVEHTTVEKEPVMKEPASIPVESEMIFYVKKHNLQAKAPTDWQYTVWKIFKNGTITAFSQAGGNVSVPFTLQLNQEGCEKIAGLLQPFTFCDAKPADGDVRWEMVGYTLQGDVAHRIDGDISGTAALEAIAEFLDTGLWAYVSKPEKTEE